MTAKILCKVGDLCEQIRGVTYSKSDVVLVPTEGFKPVLRANNITDEGLTFDDLVYVPAKHIAIKQKLKANDVLIATSSGSIDVVGKAARAFSDVDGGFGAFCKVLRPNAKVDSAYFSHYFKTKDYRRRISSLAAGANINNLRNEHLNDLEIALPPLPEQRRIAAILDKADALRAKRREAIAKFNQLLESVFLEMFGDPVMNPKGWPIVKVGDVFSSFIGGKNIECPDESSSPYRILKVSAVTLKTYRPEESKPAPEGFVPRLEAVVKSGDLLFSRANTTDLVAATAFVWNTPDNIILPDKLWKMQIANHAPARSLFLWELFKNNSFRKELSKRSSGTSGSMKNIAKSKLTLVPMPLPPLERQEHFSQVSERIHAQLQAMQNALAESVALFASLQKQAFSGELIKAG
jgi:type I restriction enzyme S subunit